MSILTFFAFSWQDVVDMFPSMFVCFIFIIVPVLNLKRRMK